MLYTLYIGANNETKEVEIDKAIDIIGNEFDGFTFWNANGFWKGSQEKTLIVQIETSKINKETLNIVIRTLKKELKQDSIGLTSADDMNFI